MNVGLSNLSTLKSWLLAPALLAGTDYDSQLEAIGKGVAGRIEQYCNRKLLRMTGDIFECSADIHHVNLPRIPVERLSKIEVKWSETDGWQDQGNVNDMVWCVASLSGLVTFPIFPGFHMARIRFTYDGGYFFEQLEPTDMGYPTTPAVGSFPLPPELLLAWQLQCEHVWTQRDKLGLAVATNPHSVHTRVVPSLALIDLLPDVKALLNSFIRYSMTT